jgi:hypothetical protein
MGKQFALEAAARILKDSTELCDLAIMAELDQLAQLLSSVVLEASKAVSNAGDTAAPPGLDG